MKFILLAFAIISVSTLSAQTHSLTGKITDCETKKVIPNNILKIIELNIETQSDNQGEFNFNNIPPGLYTLLITHPEYESKQAAVKIGKSITEVNIALCSKKSKDIDPIVITATRSPKLLKDVPITTQVITAKDIEKSQVTSIQEFFNQELPGVSINTDAGHTRINILGFGAKYILFLIDGQRLAGETFDNIDYDRINIDNIERIEIVKGASSTLYGSNAIGGVINIITKKPKKNYEAGIKSYYGRKNEQNYSINLGSKQNWGYLDLSSSYKKRDVYIVPLRKKSVTPNYIAGYESYNFAPKISININPQIKLNAGLGYFYKERNAGGLANTTQRDLYHDYTFYANGNYEIKTDQDLSISVNYDNYDKFNRNLIIDKNKKNYENQQWRGSVNYNQKIAQKHFLVAGAEIFTDELLTYQFKKESGETGSGSKNAQTYSAFTQQEWTLSKQFTLISGLRYDYHSQFKGYISPRLSGMYKINRLITLRGGYSGGFNSPTLKELYTNWFHAGGGGFITLGNKDLKAEKSNNLNLSTEVKIKNLNILAMGQYSHVKNKISQLLTASRDTLTYVNRGTTDIFSTELTIGYTVNSNLKFKGGYVYVHENSKKKTTTRPHSFSVRAEYTSSFFKSYNPTLSLQGKYLSTLNTYSTRNHIETRTHYEAYSLWKLALDAPLPNNFSLMLGIDNLFNYKTDIYSAYASVTPGRSLYCGLKWKL